MIVFRWLALAVLALPLAGCLGTEPSARLVSPATAAAATGPVGLWQGGQTMLVATTRQPDTSGDAWFGGDRGDLSSARVTLFPPDRGVLASLNPLGTEGWRIAGVERLPGATAPAAVTSAARGQDVLVYVHGFNETFDSAVTSYAGLVARLRFAGAPVLFTWPSAGAILDYAYDRESAIASRDALADTLIALADDPGIGRVNLVAHSMGGLLALEALRTIRDRRGTAIAGRIGAIVLTNPDVDLDVFRQQMRRMAEFAPKTTVIVAGDDRALEIARRVSGGVKRVGAADRSALIATGVTVVDATGFGEGLFRHSSFLSNDDVAAVIARAVDHAR